MTQFDPTKQQQLPAQCAVSDHTSHLHQMAAAVLLFIKRDCGTIGAHHEGQYRSQHWDGKLLTRFKEQWPGLYFLSNVR